MMYWTKRKPDRPGRWWWRDTDTTDQEFVMMYRVTDLQAVRYGVTFRKDSIEWSSEPVPEPVDARETCEACRWFGGSFNGDNSLGWCLSGQTGYKDCEIRKPCENWEALTEKLREV